MRAAHEVPVTHLIVDAAGFLKKARLIDIGSKLYTTQGVLMEIKDKATKDYIKSIPYSITIQEPTPESVKKIIDVSKQTGDYPSLSAPDLGIMALTLDLHISNLGEETVKYDVKKMFDVKPTEKIPATVEDGDLVGFVVPSKSMPEEEVGSGKSTVACPPEAIINSDVDDASCCSDSDECTDDEDSSDSSGDGGWIKRENFDEAVSKMDNLGLVDNHQEVACLSTDFAVQNVLKHMGVGLVSVDGFMIKKLRSYVLRCRGCMNTTSVMDKKFCPICGNKSLHRVAISVDEEGKTIVHLNYQRLESKRGLRYSLPATKGGKHNRDPIVAEDQRIAHNRMARVTNNPVMDSPFNTTDVTSRSAMLGLRDYGREGRGNRNAGGIGKKRGGKKR
uniref:RNA-binding protein NOB1 n=1 Tax=Rhabditophanes sp. KR3021 TaxID=114890 RepID=A0AC35UCN9_9BILA